MRHQLASDPVLSIVIRAHEGASWRLLDEALFSIHLATRKLVSGEQITIERVLVAQTSSEQRQPLHSDLLRMQQMLEQHAHPGDPPHKLVQLLNPEHADLRAHALNVGLAASTGRYIAFLDYDDVVYPLAYALLIQQLRAGDAVLAAGGTVRAQVEAAARGLYVMRKQPWLHLGNRQVDLLDNNFLPLHSFVIDRSRCDLPQPWFNDRLARLEDYDFLLRMASVADFDLTHLDTYVCEYRLVARHHSAADESGADFGPTNVNPLANRDTSNLAAWARAKQHIAVLKEELAPALRAQAASAMRAAKDAAPARSGASFAAYLRMMGIAVDQAGGTWAFLRRAAQLAKDLGPRGMWRRAQQMVARL